MDVISWFLFWLLMIFLISLALIIYLTKAYGLPYIRKKLQESTKLDQQMASYSVRTLAHDLCIKECTFVTNGKDLRESIQGIDHLIQLYNEQEAKND